MLLMRTSWCVTGKRAEQADRAQHHARSHSRLSAGRPGRRLAIRPDSPLIGQTLDELQLRARYGANVIGVERWRKFRRVMVTVSG